VFGKRLFMLNCKKQKLGLIPKWFVGKITFCRCYLLQKNFFSFDAPAKSVFGRN